MDDWFFFLFVFLFFLFLFISFFPLCFLVVFAGFSSFNSCIAVGCLFFALLIGDTLARGLTSPAPFMEYSEGNYSMESDLIDMMKFQTRALTWSFY